MRPNWKKTPVTWSSLRGGRASRKGPPKSDVASFLNQWRYLSNLIRKWVKMTHKLFRRAINLIMEFKYSNVAGGVFIFGKNENIVIAFFYGL